MFRFNDQRRLGFLTVLTLMFAICAMGIVPATATTTTTSGVPIIMSVQLNLPDNGQITIWSFSISDICRS